MFLVISFVKVCFGPTGDEYDQLSTKLPFVYESITDNQNF